MIKKLAYMAPILVAIFSVVTLYEANAERLAPGSMIMPAIMGLGIAGLFMLIFWLGKLTAPVWPLAALVYTGVILLWHINPIPLDIVLLVLPLILVLPVVSRRYNIRAISTYSSSFISTVLIIAILVSGVMAGITVAGKDSGETNTGPTVYAPGQANIYFIVPDRFPSPAAMRESGIDPDAFVTAMRDLGFYVNEDQLSADPYYVDWPDRIYTTRTMRYFASVLNGGAIIPMDIPYKDCREMILNNAVFTWLHGQGYSISNVPSWFTETIFFTDQDESYIFKDVTLLERFFQNELGEAYFSRTILNGFNFRSMESWGSQKQVEIARLDYQYQNIIDIAKSGVDSTFVISHILFPHEPYVYGDPKDTIPEQYCANIRAAMSYIYKLADHIRTADPTAIIIIQADEGMAYRTPKDLNYELSPVQWSGVLTAWYIPDYSGDLDLVKHTDILGVLLEK